MAMMYNLHLTLGLPEHQWLKLQQELILQGVKQYASRLMHAMLGEEVRIDIEIVFSEQFSLSINKEAVFTPEVFREAYVYEQEHDLYILRWSLALFQQRLRCIPSTLKTTDAATAVSLCFSLSRLDTTKAFEDVIASAQVLHLRCSYSIMLHQVKHPADHFSREEYTSAWRNHMFYDKGCMIPEPEFVVQDDLEDHAFQISINDLPYPLLHTFPLSYYLELDSPAEGERAIAIPNVLQHPKHKGNYVIRNYEQNLSLGENHWGWMGFLQFMLSGVVQQHAACWINRAYWNYRFDQILFHDDLKRMFLSHEKIEETILPVLRNLARGFIPIRNGKKILEAVAFSGDTFTADPDHIEFLPHLTVRNTLTDVQTAVANTPDILTDVIRKYLREELSISFTKNNTLHVILVNSALEKEIIYAEPAAWEAMQPQFLSSLNTCLKELDPQHILHGILLSDLSRERVSTLLQDIYPWLPVLTYRELAPWISVQSIDRIDA